MAESKVYKAPPSPRWPKAVEAAPVEVVKVEVPAYEPPVPVPLPKYTFESWKDYVEQKYWNRGGLRGAAELKKERPKSVDFVSRDEFQKASRKYIALREWAYRGEVKERRYGPRPKDYDRYFYKPAYSESRGYFWERHTRSKGGLYSIDPATGERVRYKRKANLGEKQIYTTEGIKTVYTHPAVVAGMEKYITGTSKTGYSIDIVGALGAGYSVEDVGKLVGEDVAEQTSERLAAVIAQRERYEEVVKESGLTSQQVAEIRSGKYKVYDYTIDELVPATKKMYEEREKFYEALPPTARLKVAPPGTPEAPLGIPGYVEAVNRIKEFVTPNPTPKSGEPEEVVDLVAAIKSKVPRSDLEMFFPKEAIDLAEETVRVEEHAASQQEWEQYYDDRWWDLRAGKIISGAERDAMIAKDPNALVAKAQPALVLPADSHWAELKDLPEDDPRRQAYKKLWGEKVIDTVAFATMVAAPWLSSAIGTGTAGITALLLRPLPLAVRATPIVVKTVGFIPRVASGLAQLVVTAGPPTHLAVRTIDEQKLLYYDTKWEEFQKLSASEKERLAIEAGYHQGYSELNEAEKANVLVHHAPPPELTSAKGLELIMEKNEWMQEQAAKGSSWIIKRAPGPGHVASFVGGAVVGVIEGVGYAASLPLALSYLTSSVPTGTSKETAAMMAAGMAMFFTTELPKALKANPALASGRIGGLFVMSPLTLAKLAKAYGYSIPRSTWAEMGNAIAISFETLRVPKVGLRATPAQMMKLGESIVQQLVTKGMAKTEAKFGEWTVKVRNIPHQQVVGDAMFTFGDSRFYPRGKSIAVGKEVSGLHYLPYHYMSPTAAPRFGVLSARGEKIANPVLVVTHLSSEYKVEIGKTLKRGEVELESTMGVARGAERSGILDPISKPDGTPLTSRGWHPDVGEYTILHYSIRGQEPVWTKLSVAQQTRILALTAKETVLDLVLGWHGRAQALGKELKANPKVKNLDQSVQGVRQWREKGKWDNIAPNDTIVSQRESIPHPETGKLHTRVTAVVRNSKGDIMLVMDRAETSYGLPGGQADIIWREGKLGFTTLPSGKKILTSAGAVHGQVKSETGVGLDKTRLLDTYAGKVNEHAMSGSRVYEALAQTDKIDISVSKGELKDAIWWDGKTEITVYPATYDILAAVAKRYGLDMSEVRIDGSRSVLNVSRDINFAKRIAEGRTFSRKELIDFAIKAELQALREWTAKAQGISEPSVLDWIFSETDLSTFGSLLMGRRKAIEVLKQKGKMSSEDALRLAREYPEMLSTRMREVASKKSHTPEELRLLQEEVRAFTGKNVEALAKEYQVAVDKAYEYSRLQGNYVGRYASTLSRVVVTGFGYTYPGRVPELQRALGLPYVAPSPGYVYPGKVPVTLRELVAPSYPVPIRIGARPYPGPYEYPTPVYPPPVIVTPEYPKLVYPEPDYPPPLLPPPPPEESKRFRPGPPEKAIKEVEVPPGSIVWRMGALKGGDVIKYIPPPYTQLKPITLVGRRPVGYRDLGKTPRETIQIIGTAEKIPKRVSVDLGIADILILDGKRIEFTGGGLMTDVGTRIPATTMGMSIPAATPLGISGLKFGTSFKEALAYQPRSEAQREFIEKQIRQMISEMSTEEFVERVKEADVPQERIRELLQYMPDRERAFSITLLAEEKLFAPIGREQYAQLKPSWREKAVEPLSEEYIAALVLTPELSAQEISLREEKGILTKKELRQRRQRALEKTKQVVTLKDML